MSEEIRNLVEEPTENAGEQTAEESVEQPKLYTQEEFDAKMDELLGKKLGRAKAKMQREYEEEIAKYRDAENVINAGMATESIEEATTKLREFYESKGVKIPERTEDPYSQEEVKVLADYEAKKIIDAGFDEVVEELNRLADKGLEKMSGKEKALFGHLSEYHQGEKDRKALEKIGVNAEVLKDADFMEFAKNLNPKMNAKEKYELFQKYKPKPQIEKMGSMTNKHAADNGVKDFYTFEEANQFTKAELDANPKLYKAILDSMPKWKR